MHGRGRAVVMILAVSVALCMAADFYRESGRNLSAVETNATVPSDSAGRAYIGGDRLVPAQTALPEAGNPAVCLGFAGENCFGENSAGMRDMGKKRGFGKG